MSRGSSPEQHSPEVVVVHRGARDAYQVARALAEAGQLDRLVTDLYWPHDRAPFAWLAARLPGRVRSLLALRHNPAVPAAQVESCWGSGLVSFALGKSRRVPFSWQRRATRWNDACLGDRAGRRAARRGALLLSYSYYGHSAFSAFDTPESSVLFQLHPHPASMRRILAQELADHPDCQASLSKEWELSLPEEDFQRLVAETTMARHWIAASSFTRATLAENGIPADRVHVVPYGVDLDRFSPSPGLADGSQRGPLRLLFVGTINQRKGIKYLLEALRSFSPRQVELMVCGRVVDDLRHFAPFSDQVQVRPSVSAGELLAAYRAADLFVFPSVAEGFGHVLLESLACGLPLLTTTHTAGPDLLTGDEQGFAVAPRDVDALRERIEWALRHRGPVAAMRRAARRRAEQFPWAAFRAGIRHAVRDIAAGVPAEAQGALTHHA